MEDRLKRERVESNKWKDRLKERGVEKKQDRGKEKGEERNDSK